MSYKILSRVCNALIAALIVGTIAHAANNYAATEGAGKTFQCTDNAGVCLPAFSLASTAGADIGSSLLSAVQAAIPAGSAIIGKVGIDQTTPGTTNAASLAYISTTAVSAGNGSADGGTQRVAISRPTTPLYSQTISSTSAISASAIPAQGGSTRFYMTDYSCSNSGSSATPVFFLNGNAAGALPIWQSIIPATGGTVKSFATAVSTTANTALIISTTVPSTTVYCNVAGYSGT